MGFLYPLLGLAALAAAVPILLHLIRRRDVKRLTFPAVRYLRRAERRHARRLRLRHLALLALRVAMVLLLAVAAMGPLWGRGAAADHRPTALAIVIDDSQSSARSAGGHRLIDLFRERAARALDLAGSDDRVAVFSAVQPDRAAVSGIGSASALLSGLQAAAGRADLPAALRRAAAWLGSAGDGRALELHVLTDLQAVSLAGSPAGDAPAERAGAEGAEGAEGAGPTIAALAFAPELPAQGNGTPGPPQTEANPLTADRHTTVSVPLHWFGPAPPSDPLVVRLVKNDDLIAVGEGSYAGGALIRLPPQDSGWVQGYVEIESQGFPVDDRRYFTWFVRPAARFALAGDGGPFLADALSALEAGGRLRRVPPPTAEVWLSAAGEGLGEGLGVDRSVVVVPPTSSLDLPRLNSRLERARVPWRYETAATTGASRIDEAPGAAGLAGLEVRQAYRLISLAVGAAEPALLRLADGEPWLIRGTTAAGATYLLLGSPLTPEATDLPVSAAMVPFLDALISDWARGGSLPPGSLDAGSPVRLPARARQVQYPDGTTSAVEGDAWLRPVQPGNYQVADDAGTALAFSVNAPVGESDLTPGDEAALEALLPKAEWRWTRDVELSAWEDVIFRARRGRLAWRPLVVLLLALSIVEAGLAAPGRGRGERLEARGEQ